jgi:hypothetical protein
MSQTSYTTRLTVPTVVVLLDHERRGVAVAVVTNTFKLDDVLGVVECLAADSAHGGRVGAMIVATVRQDRTGGDSTEPDLTNIDRWLEMSELTEQAGVELLEWFVIGHRVTCPRDQLGEPPRW